MIGLMPSIGPWELILILTIALIIFGPGKLPDAGKAIGKAFNEFRRASQNLQKDIQDSTSLEEPKPEKK